MEYCADDDDELDAPEGPDEAAKATTTGVGPETYAREPCRSSKLAVCILQRLCYYNIL